MGGYAKSRRLQRNNLIAVAALCVAAWLPEKWRMSWLVWVSCQIDHLFFKHKGWPGDRDTPRERTLFWLLKRATDSGMLFDLSLRHEGKTTLDQAIARGSGVLVIGLHASLLYLAGRHLHDLPIPVSYVGHDLNTPIFGTHFIPDYIRTNATVLIKTKKILRQQGAVYVLIDCVDKAKNTLAVDYAGESVMLSKSSIDVALSARAEIIFMNAFMRGRQPVLYWDAPPEGGAKDATAVIAHFERFLARTILERR